MIGDYIVLSLKNLKKRGARSWLTMLGIFIGIAAVVSLISLGSGLQAAITGQFSSIDPDKLIVSNAATGFGPPGSTAVKKLTEDDQELLEEVNGIDLVVPRLIRVVKVEFNDVADFSYVGSMPEDSEQLEVIYDTFNVGVQEGRLLEKNDRRKVLLGDDFKDDRFGKPLSVGKKLVMQGEEFEIIGFLERTGTFTINSAVFMPEEDMKRVLNIGDEIDVLVVQIQDINEAEKVVREIEDKMRDDRDLDVGEEDFSVETPQQSLETINTVLGTINLVIGGIAAISLFVGGVGITNTMYTSVLERRREIGVMKAVGARNRDILSIFLIESGLLGLVGGLIGAAIGLGLAYLAAFGVTLAFPGLNFGVSLSLPLITLAVLFSLVIGTVSGILPAMQASRLQPVDALRS